MMRRRKGEEAQSDHDEDTVEDAEKKQRQKINTTRIVQIQCDNRHLEGIMGLYV